MATDQSSAATRWLLPDPVLWHDGMLLLPQHFQQQSLRQEGLVDYRMRRAHPFSYGIVQLAVDQSALLGGLFRVQQLEAVMPDGMPIRYVAGDRDSDLTLDLSPYAEAMRREPLRIYGAVPSHDEINLQGGDPESRRYQSNDGEPVLDIVTGEGRERIPRLVPNLRLVAARQPSAKLVTLPLAEVSLRDENVELTSYVPPMMLLSARFALWRELTLLGRRLREKISFISERIDAAGTREAEAVVYRLTLSAMSTFLPQLETQLLAEASSPFEVYQTLAAIIGAVSPIGRNRVPPTLRGYQHEEPRAAFDEAVRLISTALDEIQEDYLSIPFVPTAQGFSLRLRREWMTRNLILRARIPPGGREEDTVAWINSSVIASSRMIGSLRERRVLGAARLKVGPEHGLDLPVGPRTLLFAVRNDAELIVEDEEFVVANFLDRQQSSRPAELILHVKQGPGDAHAGRGATR